MCVGIVPLHSMSTTDTCTRHFSLFTGATVTSYSYCKSMQILRKVSGISRIMVTMTFHRQLNVKGPQISFKSFIFLSWPNLLVGIAEQLGEPSSNFQQLETKVLGMLLKDWLFFLHSLNGNMCSRTIKPLFPSFSSLT